MMKSHWARYREEYGNIKFIENESGFISYVELPDSFFVEDIWVIPEKRKTGLGLSLLKEVEALAVAQGKQFLICRIYLDSKVIPENLKAALAVDFVPFKAHNDELWLRRKIEV